MRVPHIFWKIKTPKRANEELAGLDGVSGMVLTIFSFFRTRLERSRIALFAIVLDEQQEKRDQFGVWMVRESINNCDVHPQTFTIYLIP